MVKNRGGVKWRSRGRMERGEVEEQWRNCGGGVGETVNVKVG